MFFLFWVLLGAIIDKKQLEFKMFGRVSISVKFGVPIGLSYWFFVRSQGEMSRV